MTDTDELPPPPESADAVSLGALGWLARLGSIFWNRDERRLRALFRILGLVLLFGGASLAIRAAGWLPAPGTLGSDMVRILVRTALALGVVGLGGRLLDRRRLHEFGLALGRRWVVDLIFGLVLGAGLMSGVFLVGLSLGWFEITGVYQTTVAGEPFGRAILGPLVLFIGVGIVEELLARGYLLRNLAEGLSFRTLGGARGGLIVACVISSAFFALGHAHNPHTTWISTVNIGIAGVFLALGYMLTGQLAIPIGLHISWNFFQASVYGFAVSGMSHFGTTFIATEAVGPEAWTGGAFGPEAGLLGLAAMLMGMGLVLGWVRWQWGQVRLLASLAEPPARPRPSKATEPPSAA